MSEEMIKGEIHSITKEYKKNKRKVKLEKVWNISVFVLGNTFPLLLLIISFKFFPLNLVLLSSVLCLPFIAAMEAILCISCDEKDLLYDKKLENLEVEYDKKIKKLEKELAKVNTLKLEKNKKDLDFLESILPELVGKYINYSYDETGLSKEELKKLKDYLVEYMNSSIHEAKQDLKEAENELIKTDNSILGSSKLPESCNYEPEEYSPLAYDNLKLVNSINDKQGPILKKKRK